MVISIMIRVSLALLLSLYLSVQGYRKKSLNKSGAIAAFFVGLTSFSVSYRFGILLISFYYSSSKLTKVKSGVKKKLEADFKESGQRDYVQVLSNSVLATLLALTFYFVYGEDNFAIDFKSSNALQSQLLCAYITHYAVANGDTWASELGILSTKKPRLITSLFLKEVPPGTNGGVSLLGTVASLTGGIFIALTYYIISFVMIRLGYIASTSAQWPVFVLGAWSGLVGSLVDSLLGATLQGTISLS